jgi:hypothetical protein
MTATEPAPAGDLVLKPCSRAFFVYYVAIAIFVFGPRINPNVRILGLFDFSAALGAVLGLLVLALVVYMRFGREYRLTPRGAMTVWRWPAPRQQEIAWKDLGEVQVRRGLTQTILKVGNIYLEDKSGGTNMLWFGLPNPKEIKEEIEKRRQGGSQ